MMPSQNWMSASVIDAVHTVQYTVLSVQFQYSVQACHQQTAVFSNWVFSAFLFSKLNCMLMLLLLLRTVYWMPLPLPLPLPLPPQ